MRRALIVTAWVVGGAITWWGVCMLYFLIRIALEHYGVAPAGQAFVDQFNFAFILGELLLLPTLAMLGLRRKLPGTQDRRIQQQGFPAAAKQGDREMMKSAFGSEAQIRRE
jgi:hypothetical protein